jgi:hypothetical protein
VDAFYYDLLIYSMLGIPAFVGAAYGVRGLGAAAWAAVAGLMGLPALLVVLGLLPGGICEDCADLGLFLPYMWLFVLAMSQGTILVAMAVASLIGWALGRWIREGSGEVMERDPHDVDGSAAVSGTAPRLGCLAINEPTARGH